MLPSFARCTRLLTATIAVLGVLAGAAASAQAQPTCPVGGKLCLETTHSPDTAFVTQGSVVTYRVVVSNIGTATATKVSLRFEIEPTREPTLPRRATAILPLPAGCSVASAPARNVITCSLGSVKPTGSNPIVRLFNVRMPATAATISSVASLSYDARASDTGNDPTDPTPESFSDIPEDVDVKVVDGQAVSAVPDGVPLELNTDPDGSGATGDDLRTAVFRLTPHGFSTTAVINDLVPDQSFVCPEKLKCPTGGWTDATIPGPPNPLAFFDLFQVELNYDAATVPKGLTEKSYVMLHLTNAGVLEQISQRCSSSNPPPCLQEVELQQNGDLKAVALATGNHRFR
jgi:hypothetical protein